MRIAHALAPGAFGGLERVVEGLARLQKAAGDEVAVLAALSEGSQPPAWLQRLEAGGIPVHAVRSSARGYLKERNSVRQMAERMEVSVLHTHGDRADVVNAPGLRRRPFVSVATVHGFTAASAKQRITERLHRMALHRYDRVIAVSGQLADDLVAAGLPAARLSIVPNAVLPGGEQTLDRRAARSELGLPPEAFVVGWVGRFVDVKDPLLAVDAFVAAQVPGALLCMLGDGPLRDAAAQRAQQAGRGDAVVFPGAVEDAARLMPAFDVLLLSSKSEGTPMVALEGASRGIPVASTRVGGVPALLGESPFLSAPGDASALGSILHRIGAEPTLASDVAARCRQFVLTRHGSDAWVSHYRQVYDTALRDAAR